MLRIPLKFQIIATPVLLVVPIFVVMLITLSYLADIAKQNDTVRDWVHATDQVKIAISAGYRLQKIIEKIDNTKKSQQDELHFNYIEQSQLLHSSLAAPTLQDKLTTEQTSLFKSSLEKIDYQENMDFNAAFFALAESIPKLEYIFNILQARKRSIYIQSNQDINIITDRLGTVMLSVLGVCIILGIALSIFVGQHISRRIKSISDNVKAIAQGESTSIPKPQQIQDELDELCSILSSMTTRINKTLASEKILQGMENERHRIAMDIHDHFLAEISHLQREIENPQQNNDSSRQLRNINHTLSRLSADLRAIIHDLYPHTLDMLGLEAAITDYINRQNTYSKVEFYINIDTQIDNHLTQDQLLHIYRIMVEVINNALHHAHCNQVEIVFRRIDNQLLLTIDDNGSGFDKTIALQKGHLGLLTILQRASILHAEADWSGSRFSSGTCFKLKFVTTPGNIPGNKNTDHTYKQNPGKAVYG